MSVVGKPAPERPALRLALVAADPIRHQSLIAIVRGGSLRSARASSSWRAKATRRYRHNLGERLAATAYRNTG
jgi:hypothetical protein